MSGTPALAPGTVLARRFEIERILGRGGFSIAYVANDLAQGDECVVKELAPAGAQRKAEVLDLSSVHSTNPQRLRKRFLEEANLIGTLDLPGVLGLRDAFEENETAYYVTDTVPGARTLDSIISQDGRMDAETVADIFFQLLDILEAVHQKRILHRDIKPANILLSPNGEVYLIDFGAARESHADSAALQTVLFTPGYAPIEQLSDRGKRGPATDVYALCATAYHLLAGFPPRPSAERVDGTEIAPLSRLRPDVDRPILNCITEGLKLHFRERPQSIAQLRALALTASEEEEPPLDTLEAFDATAQRLKRFGYNRHQCPVCSSLLERPKPLKPGTCPACRNGRVKLRHLSERLCPSCRNGILQPFKARTALLHCPICKKDRLEYSRKGILLNRLEAACPSCDALLVGDAHGASIQNQPGDLHPWEYWRGLSERASETWICDLCAAEYDPQPSGKWRSMADEADFHPDEWARIAVGLKPDAGNAFCDRCEADFWWDVTSLTLLSYFEDPYGFGARFLDERIASADVPWLGCGKTSGNPGLVCLQCDTEFDDEEDYMVLVHSPSVRLSRHLQRALVCEDWHRLAQGLPMVGEEEQFFHSFDETLRRAFDGGDVTFDDRDQALLWSSAAHEVEQEDGELIYVGEGTLTVKGDELIYGRLLRRWRVPLSAILSISSENNLIRLSVSGEESSRAFEIVPAELQVTLNSGRRSVRLGASSLCAVLKRHMLVNFGS
jgi:serine/threonine protein kinase